MTPYTVRSLAERWACSEQHVRNLVARGELHCFRLGGKLLRIAGEEVARWENSGLAATVASSASSSAKTDTAAAIRSARLIEASPTQGWRNSLGLNVHKLKADELP
jgi:excisionase family DNA binding protein